ncbi:hypothetical protein HK097_000126 [Rhizophlyctis rosea]|uniref:Uncharacterized protein n=1 Tax=Rhizophlyctis rosea TaxID=64517 RepID=A0AAD5S8H0_9FUNG|nr:hypothetical protein HK097_000126 [Rhizophlyctis rosea]
MDPITITAASLSALTGACKCIDQITAFADGATRNREICTIFSSRVINIRAVLHKLHKRIETFSSLDRKSQQLEPMLEEPYYLALKYLEEVLRQIEAFVELVSQRHWFIALLKTMDDKRRFQELITDLGNAQNDLHLGLVTHTVMAVEKARAYRTYERFAPNRSHIPDDARMSAAIDEKGNQLWETMERYKVQASETLLRRQESLRGAEVGHSPTYLLVLRGEELHRAKQYNQAWEIFVRQAARHNLRAIYWVGYYYFHGYGNATKDIKRAQANFDSARDVDMDAQYMYAMCLHVRKKLDLAVTEYSVAAKAGHIYAHFHLGQLLVNGSPKVPEFRIDKDRGVVHLQYAAGFKVKGAQELLRQEGFTWVDLEVEE